MTPSHPTPDDTKPVERRWNIEWLDETTSTQTDLLQRCDDGTLVDRTALAALYQSAGRGRLDRRWDAPPGSNLLVSLGFIRPPLDPPVVMRAVALAVLDTARRNGLADVALKWPNDLLVVDRKLAGLLAQRHQTGALVIGVGLNVNWAPEGAARLLDADPQRGELALDVVLRTLLDSLDSSLTNQTDVDRAYRNSLATIGQRVRVEHSGGELIGTAIDIDEDGSLVIDADGSRRVVFSGDVHHLRPA